MRPESEIADKRSYIAQEQLKLVQYWISLVFGPGVIVIVALSALDYLVTPENFAKFVVYRVGAASIVALLYFLNRLRASRPFQIFLVVTSIIAVAGMVELMILSFGGHQSTYYAGMIIIYIFVLGFLPFFSFRLTLSFAILTYSIYIFPILLFDPITNMRIFYNNNIFLFSAIGIGVLWRHYNDGILLKKLSLEYDLARDKEKLAKYSTQLEHLVEERTRELNKSETMLRALFENANDGIMIIDTEGVVIDANQKAYDIHGFEYDALKGANIKLLETKENLHLYEERMARILKGEALLFETEHYRRDGSKVSLEISAKAIEVDGKTYVQSFHRDITEKKRLQEQLSQSQKMESIGVLAGGIAHDFNNILTAILGHAELLHEHETLDLSGKQRVKIIETSARKAGQMISKLLSFARKGAMESVPILLNTIVKDTIDLLERMLSKKNISIALETDPLLPYIEGDGNQLEQVIMNLVLNASDVMPSGGVVTISTSVADLKYNAPSIHPLLSPGKYVLLKVSDTGTGIAPEIIDKIFDPFFSTKEKGKGTGLGLSMVYGIVRHHKGVITVDSQVGKGTTFAIYLPASAKVMQDFRQSSSGLTSGAETILVVDDEKEILSFIRDVLDRRGYKVITTDSPIYALDLFRELGETIDLVITDIIMPLINGRELLRHLKELKPGIKVIAISGYDPGKMGDKDNDIDMFIQKPFEGATLLSVVRKVLDSRILSRRQN